MATNPNRDAMIVGAMRTGMTREQASILTDVSKHAFESGMATVMRDQLPEHWKAFCAADDTHDQVIVLPGGPADA